VADGGEDDVGGIAGAAFEVAAPEVAFGPQVSDDGLDSGAARSSRLLTPKTPRFWPEMKTRRELLRVVAAVSLVEIGPLDRTAGECLAAVNDVPQGVTVAQVIG
jgi:hypothetical protein